MITSINGTRLESSDDYTAYLAEHPLTSEPVTITYVRDGLEYNAEVTPSESRTAVLDFSYNLAYTKTHGFEVLKYGTLEVKIYDPFYLTQPERASYRWAGRKGFKRSGWHS